MIKNTSGWFNKGESHWFRTGEEPEKEHKTPEEITDIVVTRKKYHKSKTFWESSEKHQRLSLARLKHYQEKLNELTSK